MKQIFTEKDDHDKFFLERGDPDFSPERNTAVVENSIKKYEAMRKKKAHEFDDAYRERADATVAYLRKAEANPGYGVDKYLGRKMLTYLRGDEIRRKLMENVRILDNNGRDVTKHYV